MVVPQTNCLRNSTGAYLCGNSTLTCKIYPAKSGPWERTGPSKYLFSAGWRAQCLFWATMAPWDGQTCCGMPVFLKFLDGPSFCFGQVLEVLGLQCLLLSLFISSEKLLLSFCHGFFTTCIICCCARSSAMPWAMLLKYCGRSAAWCLVK